MPKWTKFHSERWINPLLLAQPHDVIATMVVLQGYADDRGVVEVREELLAVAIHVPLERLKENLKTLEAIGLVWFEDDRPVVISVRKDFEYSDCRKTWHRKAKKGRTPSPTQGATPGPTPSPTPSPTPGSTQGHLLVSGLLEEREEKAETDQQEKTVPKIPDALCTPAFELAWMDYQRFRKAAKFKPWKLATIEAQFAEWATWGAETATEALRNSIRQGWQGVFHPRGTGKYVPAPTDWEQPKSMDDFFLRRRPK